MKILALGLTLGILARSWALVSLVRHRLVMEYCWLAMFLLIGCARSTALCWLLLNGGKGYNKLLVASTGLMQLLVLAVVLESAWKLMKSVKGK